MALKPCRECKKKVSTEASTCPSCGVPNPTKITKNNNSKGVLPSDGFWSGNKGLSASFWGYFIGGNIVANFFYFLAFNNGGQKAIALILVAQVIWNIFATVAVFNSAEIYKTKKINAGKPYGWATTAKVINVILILSAIGNSLKYFR